jgi:cyclase
VKDPSLVSRMSSAFGSQCIVVAIDARKVKDRWLVVTHGGRNITDRLVEDWAMEVADRGAGEILLTSMEHDGTKAGFAVEITRMISEKVNIPVIASGGAGNKEHFREIFIEGKADAALAASVFHFGEIPIPSLKQYLHENGIAIRNK